MLRRLHALLSDVDGETLMETRQIMQQIADEVGVDLWDDVRGGHPFSGENMMRVVAAVKGKRLALAVIRGLPTDGFIDQEGQTVPLRERGW